jgi:hypothetical protein
MSGATEVATADRVRLGQQCLTLPNDQDIYGADNLEDFTGKVDAQVLAEGIVVREKALRGLLAN